LAVLTAAAAATPAVAQDTGKGLYVQFRTGAASLNNPDFSETDLEWNERIDGRLHTKSAWVAGGEAGYDLGGLRVGLEVSHQRNKVKGIEYRALNGTAITAADMDDYFDADESDGLELDGTTVRATSGSIAKLRQVAVMANVTYDIPVGDMFKPYVGVGLGGVGTHLKVFDEDDGSFRFAWQVRAGAAVKVTRGVDLTADYTYRQTSGGKLSFGDDEDYQYRLGKTKASLFQVGLRFTL
jgi:opacity protein-like surface antigen